MIGKIAAFLKFKDKYFFISIFSHSMQLLFGITTNEL